MQENSFRKFKKIPLIISTILLIFSFFIYFFIYKNINKNEQIFEETQATWLQEYSKKNEIKSVERYLKTISEEKILLDSHFIKSSDIVPFLNTIERLAPRVKTSTEVTSVDVVPGNTSLTVGVKASGSFEGLYKFLTLLENSPYQIEFLSMSMKKNEAELSSGEDSVPEWSVVFKIKLLSFME